MSTIADLEEAVQRYASIRMMVHPCHPLCYDSVMKRLLTTLALLCALSTFVFASTDPFMEPQVVPFYNYVSISTGYAPNFKISQGTVAQSVPLGLAAGVLANNTDGSFAIGFGSRADFRFGVGADSSDFSLDSLFALEGMARLGRHFGLDFMVGAAVSVVDDEAMEGGAFGGSFGFMYEPGIYSKHDELVAFAKRIAKYDGILTVHPRACSKVALGYPLLSKPHIELALDEVVDIMKESGVRTEYSHLIFVGKTSWKSLDPMLAKFHRLNDEGCRIAYDNYSFTYGASVITVVLPPWYMALPEADRKKPFNMFKLKLMTNITKLALGLDFCDFTVAYISDDPAHKKYEGKTVSECAKEEGLSDFDMYIKLVDLSRGQGRLYLGKYYNDEIINRLMTDSLSVFMTDAWVEAAGTQNGAAYQGFPYFLVRAREHDIPLESVIHKMTGKTAERFSVKERGTLAAGNYADITVFDYAGVKVDPAVPDFTPQGIKHVYVNGTAAVKDGSYLTQRAGKLILKK